MYKSLLLSLILLSFLSFEILAKTWTIKYSGYGEIFEKIKLTDGSTTGLYKNKGTWEDSLGNYGTRSCIGMVEMNSLGKLLVGRFFCEAIDNEDNKYILKGIRGDNNMDAGLGNMTIIDGNGKWEDIIGSSCNYAIRYKEEALFQIDNCATNHLKKNEKR